MKVTIINDFSVGEFCVMATAGDIKSDPEENASGYDHDLEILTPYYYVPLDDYNIGVEYTATDHSAFYRFSFPGAVNSNILMSILQTGEMKITGDDVIEGYHVSASGRETGRKLYFYSKFSKSFRSFGSVSSKTIKDGEKEKAGNNIGIYTTYSTSEGEQVQLKVGFSYISIEQAHQNLEKEIMNRDFEQIKSQGREIWNRAL
jgi:putative alpha-1,2-mannosidase